MRSILIGLAAFLSSVAANASEMEKTRKSAAQNIAVAVAANNQCENLTLDAVKLVSAVELIFINAESMKKLYSKQIADGVKLFNGIRDKSSLSAACGVSLIALGPDSSLKLLKSK